ncbi:hypothetical protein [Streptosporangium roseum]|uniref:hypothetical protein n=1 Tax=Streptosporangium roseum TaxID=2001 RepID=UPI0004CD721E|nr:hypothetical protein [Streptosporangium roseum]
MRIRFLAAAVVTAGALMATLTGAANASDDPAPSTPEAAFTIVCEAGDDQGAVAMRRLTDAELKDLQAKGGHWRKTTAPDSVKVTGGTGHLASVKVTEVTEATETTKATETTETTDSVPATPAVPATPLDPSKQTEAEVAGTTTVRVSPQEDEGRLDVLSHGVQVTGKAEMAKAVPGAPLPEGVVVACAQKAERAQEPGEAGE